MKFIVVAGTPHSGKTSVLMHVIRELKQNGLKPSVVKIDCIWTDDDRRFEREQIPVRVGISGDMCPDHFSIYNIEDIISWAEKENSDIVINETAGLCLRCAPYTTDCLAICVVDVTSGPYTPKKIGPLLTTADIVVMTKGDMVSQAEREVFHEKILEVNKKAKVIDANGLSGRGSLEITDLILNFKTPEGEKVLRHNPPLSVCTLCTGERRIGKKYHFGVLRNIEGVQSYDGE